jgi:hypothetical protein
VLLNYAMLCCPPRCDYAKICSFDPISSVFVPFVVGSALVIRLCAFDNIMRIMASCGRGHEEERERERRLESATQDRLRRTSSRQSLALRCRRRHRLVMPGEQQCELGRRYARRPPAKGEHVTHPILEVEACKRSRLP